MTASLISVSALWSPAFGQTIFCPPTVSGVSNNFQTPNGDGQAPYSLQNGRCTNGTSGNGAFSGAALASQALTGLSQSTTTETNRTTANALANRREEEAKRTREAQVQVQPRVPAARLEDERERRSATRRTKASHKLQRSASRRAAEEAAVEGGRAAASRGRDRIRSEVPPSERPAVRPLISKGDGLVPPQALTVVPETLRYGAWAQGFGDFEQRSGRSASSIVYSPSDGTFTFPFQISQKSTTRTVGFLGGIDLTKRDVAAFGDGLIFGLMTGYTDTSVNILTRTTYSPEAVTGRAVAPGVARTNVALYGPSLGAYATYFRDGFSFDQIVKADFFGLDQRFSESAGFAGLDFFRAQGALGSITGAGQTGVIQLSSIGNANYRFAAAGNWWLEPTVGYQYIHSSYESSAAALGLRDGDLVRVQGGARVGYQGFVGTSLLTVTLTGLAYNNVLIDGGFIQSGAFGSNVLTLNDEGKTRGEGILTVALDHGNGLSSFVQGNVRGGDRYFGAGGRAGFRYQW